MLFGIIPYLHTSAPSHSVKKKTTLLERKCLLTKTGVYVDARSFLGLGWWLPAIWSLSRLWNSLKEKSIIFLIFQNSEHYLEFLIPGKGLSWEPATREPPAGCAFLPRPLPALQPAARPPPCPLLLPSGSLVALASTQSLCVMKSFKMVSLSGENTCF